MKPVKTQSGRGQPTFDLARTLTLLVESIQSAMAALYNVETAAINSRPGVPPDKFETDRRLLRDLWENMKGYLQDCHAYAEDFVSFGDFLDNRTLEECLDFLDTLSSESSHLQRHAKSILKEHDIKHKKIRKHGQEVVQWFRSSSRSDASRRRSTGHSSVKSTTTTRQYTVPPVTGTPLIQAVNGSLNPDGPQSVAAFANAADDIRTHLNSLIGFWGDECHAFNTKNAPYPKIADLKKNAERWKKYLPVIMSAITSIAASSDAVTVHAIGDPRSFRRHSVSAGFSWLCSLRRE